MKLIEFFSGVGFTSMALKKLVSFSHHKTSDWNIPSVISYANIHFTKEQIESIKKEILETMDKESIVDVLFKMQVSTDGKAPMTMKRLEKKRVEWLANVYACFKISNNLGSITEIEGGDLEIDNSNDKYLLSYSYPCFTSDSLVLTNSGYKRIVDLSTEDYVLTHTNTYKKVLNTFDNGMADVYTIKGMGNDEIKATSNHKFLVREMYRKGHLNIRTFREPKWKELKDLTKKDYLGVAINQNSTIPTWNGVDFIWTDGRKTRHKNQLSELMSNETFWWIIGRYIGDGWIRTGGGIIICCAKNETGEITKKLEGIFNYVVAKERTVNKIHIPLKELGAFVMQFGRGAANKRLTNTILDLPIKLLNSFVDGYISANGSYDATKNLYKSSSVSRELIYGIAQCVAKIYKTPYRIYKVVRPSKYIIEGRVVNQKPSWQIAYKVDKRKQDKAFYENGYIWYPIKTVEYFGKENVYDIEVEEDHSFTVQNTIVHNCQDLSLAGKGEGMSKGLGTRSGLLWEVERILLESSKIENGLPQILLMENVTQVHGKKHLADFEMWIKFLESLGYKNYWADLNAKHYGVPQNRDRTFMVSILGEHRYFMFPDRQELSTKLKDILEKEVDEKYYLDTKVFEKLKDTSPIESQNVNERFFKQAYETSTAKHGDTVDAYNKKLNMSGVSPTITTRPEGFKTAILPVIAASRGRNIENPSDRTKGIELEQRLEINKEGLSNTLTTVQKDNYVLETVFTETQARRITPDGNVKRYIDSDIIDKFEDGDCADISFPNGYNKGNRVFKQHAPTINTTTTQTSFIVKEEFTELQKKVVEEALKNNLLKPYDVIDYTYSNSRLSEIELGFIKKGNASDGNIMATLTTNAQNFGVCIREQSKPKVKSLLRDVGVSSEPSSIGFRVRKLTPKECWRLMGATDEEFELAKNGLKDYLHGGKDMGHSQLYHQAGNGIVVNVLVEIFKQILKSVGE